MKGKDFIIGFQDESSPQTTSNTVRLWSPDKLRIVKNTTKIKANAMGFYPLNGTPVIEFPESSKTGDMCLFLESVRRWNDDRPIIMVIDNFAVHRSRAVAEKAAELNVHMVFLPPYCPHLNPIEFIWKTLKRIVSTTRFIDRSHMTGTLADAFGTESVKSSYASNWPFKALCGIS